MDSYFVLNLKLCSTVLQFCSEDCSLCGPAPCPTSSSSPHSTCVCHVSWLEWAKQDILSLQSLPCPQWTWRHRHLWFSKLSWYVFWYKTKTLSPNVGCTQHIDAMDDEIICWWLMTLLWVMTPCDDLWLGHELSWWRPPPAHDATGPRPESELVRAGPGPANNPGLSLVTIRQEGLWLVDRQCQGPASDRANTPPPPTLQNRFHQTKATLRKLWIMNISILKKT